MEDVLKIDKLLDYCDQPQLFTARDNFDTLYLCLMYEDEPVSHYIAIRVSTRRLEQFYLGNIDLRTLFIQPENTEEYFDVTVSNHKLLKRLSNEKELTEDKLPASGYTFSGDIRENVIVNLPMKDRSLLAELVRKFGWACM